MLLKLVWFEYELSKVVLFNNNRVLVDVIVFEKVLSDMKYFTLVVFDELQEFEC